MQTINHEELEDMLNQYEDLLLINVLSNEAFREHHVPGSVNIPVEDDDFVSQVESLAESKEQPVVVYCANTECDASPRAASKLVDAGFSNVYDFAGGIEEWEQAKHRVATGVE